MSLKSILVVLVALSGVLDLTGCGLNATMPAASPMPTPVVDHGMTLDWGMDVKRQALQMIAASKKNCYLDIYELSDPDILAALSAARRRGVDVRVVVDAKEKHSQQQGLPILRHDGVPVASLTIHQGISHIKMLWVDGQVLMGGMNFGAKSWNNNDAAVLLPTANLSFLALFHWDWARAKGSPAAAPSAQTPLLNERATQSHVIQAIQGARKNVYLEAFDLSDWGVTDALKVAARKGVKVEVLLDPGQSPNRHTAPELRDAGVLVRFYKPYQGEWMHAKILEVDHGATFIIGSANFSHQAYTYNHEGDMEFHGVPLFGKSLEENMAMHVSRGTDLPTHNQQYGT